MPKDVQLIPAEWELVFLNTSCHFNLFYHLSMTQSYFICSWVASTVRDWSRRGKAKERCQYFQSYHLSSHLLQLVFMRRLAALLNKHPLRRWHRGIRKTSNNLQLFTKWSTTPSAYAFSNHLWRRLLEGGAMCRKVMDRHLQYHRTREEIKGFYFWFGWIVGVFLTQMWQNWPAGGWRGSSLYKSNCLLNFF